MATFRPSLPGLALGTAFALVLGGAGSFLSSPWSTQLDVASLTPILTFGAIGFAFGYVAAERIRLGWIVWLLTVPGVAAFTWTASSRCDATTPGDDCGVVSMLLFGWLVPWAVGIVLLSVATVTRKRSRLARSPARGASPRRSR